MHNSSAAKKRKRLDCLGSPHGSSHIRHFKEKLALQNPRGETGETFGDNSLKVSVPAHIEKRTITLKEKAK